MLEQQRKAVHLLNAFSAEKILDLIKFNSNKTPKTTVATNSTENLKAL